MTNESQRHDSTPTGPHRTKRGHASSSGRPCCYWGLDSSPQSHRSSSIHRYLYRNEDGENFNFMIYACDNFDSIVAQLHHGLLEASPVDTGHWQSLKNVPHTATRELFRVCVETPIPQTREAAQEAVQPNLPWAEDHFQERVGGLPTNPGSQYMNWPWYQPGWKAQQIGGADCTPSPIGGAETAPPLKFSHTYQERMWPRMAGYDFYDPGQIQRDWGDNRGIRYRYGDLNDVVELLAREPTTRQAFLPIWFPEDTGAHHKERVPCTLGYHFILRGGLLHVTYYIRSCDFLRYFRDDVYMAMRLGQWIREELVPRRGQHDEEDRNADHPWAGIDMGILQMNIVSLHVFEGDMPKMRREAPPTP